MDLRQIMSKEIKLKKKLVCLDSYQRKEKETISTPTAAQCQLSELPASGFWESNEILLHTSCVSWLCSVTNSTKYLIAKNGINKMCQFF